MHRPETRKILVTGASRGIGAAITRRLLAAGSHVVAVARDFSDWAEHPPQLETITLDLSDLDGLPDQLGEITHTHSELDGLILNAGHGRFGSLEEFSYQQIREMVEINLLQHIYMARALTPHLKKQGHGDLVIIGSEAALSGGRKGAVYSACKFALRGLAQSLREECSQSGVRVSLINPGMVDTPFYDELDFAPGEAPENHLRPEDVADAVEMVLQAHPGTVFDEINLNPLKKVIRFKK
ncbi:MAG: SDR family oxidoreductase [Candidatus Thiodiazotropha sp. (ex Notomyrtea botanica)]|nr:SDR family oxidoreductase [Candidatus Thiodiazotropha sp. (ex Notomyrtea botanica)]